ncbi:hypothetical protein [Roseospira navarrensis]|uniref:Uncharacterized protein n=1 Tax=Roseospira navarrensis TaxID=140058 RepID=A0A7X1ZIR4_9PROT|nr:hypothetical protein [Roseospira navarrensis]MQX37995.1 hypothetical protein [Roseospira navarrensis]
MTTFEVQVMRDGRWMTESILDREAEAVLLAKKLLNAGTSQGARVISERSLGGDLTAERTVFEETRDIPDKRPVAISAIDEAPWCETADELYALPARMTMARLLRTYLDRNTVTVSELLYAFRPLSKLQNHDSNIYPSAVDKVASLQAQDREDLDTRTRRDALYGLIDEVGRRARRAEGERMMRGAGLDTLHEAYDKARMAAFDPAEQAFLVRAAIGRDLAGRQSWLGKLDALLSAVSDDLPDGALAMLDEFIADCLGIGQVVQDILGDRPNLAVALLTLIDLVEGKGETGAGGQAETAQVLAALFAAGKLPSSATVLMDRVYREVAGRSPLSRNDPSREHEFFEVLCDRVISVNGLLGAHRMAVAITRRYNHRINQGGDAGWRQSIVGVSSSLANSARRLHYLAALSGAREVQPYGGLILDLIVDGIKTTRGVDDFAAELPPAQKLATVTGVQRALMDGPAMPDVMRDRVFEHFDSMLARYVEKARIIEKLDNPDDSLRKRADRLISFCASGVLMEGKALTFARKRVLSYLKRPDFTTEFLSDVPQPQQEEELRRLHMRLARAGFGVGG